jgi:REP element-mobilizing transposase RayT
MTDNRWRNRGYLPHYEGGELTQAITFSLENCLPNDLLIKWKDDFKLLSATERESEYYKRIQSYLDKGYGKAWLKDRNLAQLVQNAILFNSEKRYTIHSWVIMPTHVHFLFTPNKNEKISDIMHSIKSYTSNEANKYLRRRGTFWLKEYFDRFIRNEEHFCNEIIYIENNPVKAGLCKYPEEWEFSSANFDFNRLNNFAPINEIVFNPPSPIYKRNK